MVKVKITYNQVVIGEKRKNSFGRNGAGGRVICSKEIHRGDPEGAVGGSKKTLRRKNIN